jgi:hypothetical protein
LDLPRDRRKALESEAQERGGLKMAPEGRRAEAVKRVAKPWRRNFRAAW